MPISPCESFVDATSSTFRARTCLQLSPTSAVERFHSVGRVIGLDVLSANTWQVVDLNMGSLFDQSKKVRVWILIQQIQEPPDSTLHCQHMIWFQPLSLCHVCKKAQSIPFEIGISQNKGDLKSRKVLALQISSHLALLYYCWEDSLGSSFLRHWQLMTRLSKSLATGGCLFPDIALVPLKHTPTPHQQCMKEFLSL